MVAALPNELQLNIFKDFCDHCNHDFHDEYKPSSYQPLLNLCLTSKSIRHQAQKVLFHNFQSLNKHPLDSLACFAMTLYRNPDLAKEVIRFSYIAFEMEGGLGRYLVEEILRQTENLQECQVHLHWAPTITYGSSVKRLHIYNPYSAQAEISATSLQRITKQKRLQELSLTRYKIGHSLFFGLPLSIRRLNLVDVEADIALFVKDLRRIEWFEWSDNAAERENPPDILAKILPWGNTLEEMHLRTKSWAIDCTQLHLFPLLRKGRLRCPSINAPRGTFLRLPSGGVLKFIDADSVGAI